MEFNGDRILVTGATKGIGRATAQLLAKRGARIVAVGRSEADLKSLADEIGCETRAVDLADPAATLAAAKALQPIDRLVNNAGTTTLQSFLDTTLESFDELMAVNVKAPLLFAQETARSLIGRGKGGTIVNVSSMAAFQGVVDHAAYCATKGALDAMTRVMAVELGPKGIRVNTINPVITLTPMAVKAWSDPEKAGAMLKRIPLGRFLEPMEVAEAIAFYLSDRSGALTGTSVQVDGGFRAA